MDLDDLAFLLGGDTANTDAQEEWRNLWVLAQRSATGFTRVTRQMLGRGRELADRLGVRLEAVLVGGHESDGEQLIALGADHVYWFAGPEFDTQSADGLLAPLAGWVAERRPEIVLVGATPLGTEWAGRLAERLDTGVVAWAGGLDLDEAERRLVVTRQSFGGRALADVVIPHQRPQIATVCPNAFAEAMPEAWRIGAIERVELADGVSRVVVTGEEALPAVVPLARARTVVVAGKGVSDAEGLALVRQFAEAIGASLGGTHSVIEAGLLDESFEVSTRRTVIAPDLYIGIGVSGSMEHLDAMRQSRVIVAINTKADTALMELADYAVVGDFKEVLTALLAAMHQRAGHPVSV
jgi:electron transfer flavoprotein alpha subunit